MTSKNTLPEHEGWANYFTFFLGRWILNDRGLYEELQERFMDVGEEDWREKAEIVKGFIKDVILEEVSTAPYPVEDIMDYVLDYLVDWEQIAKEIEER